MSKCKFENRGWRNVSAGGFNIMLRWSFLLLADINKTRQIFDKLTGSTKDTTDSGFCRNCAIKIGELTDWLGELGR